MVSKILLIVVVLLTIFGYMGILILYLKNKNKESNKTGYSLALNILDDDTSIKLIKSRESIFSKYNIPRNMVKLSSNTYDSSDDFSLSITTILSGYSISGNKYLSIIGKIFKELKIFSYSPLIVVLISIITTNRGDAKIGIIFLILVSIYQYILNIINTDAIEVVKKKKKEVVKILNSITNINTMFFISSLIGIIRLVVIMLNI